MISWQTHNFKPWLRTVALLTVCVFTFTSIVWDGGVKAYAAAPKPESFTPVGTFKAGVALSLIDRPDLPDSYGTIKSSFKGNREQIVLHIQDAHVNEEAQRNIANILRYFSEKYQLGLVNLEGASGELYTELFSFFPNKEARRNVADYFLKEGRLTGPEYLAIVEKPAMTLYGVEDKELYEENRKAYVDALQFKTRDEEILTRLNKVLEGVSRFVFPAEMRELIRRRAAFQEGGPELTSYVRYLVELGRKHNIALDEYPGMHSLIQLVDLEKKVDFDKAEKETDELINDLKRVLSREKLSRFLTNTVHFRMKKMKRAAYYGYLQDEIQGVSVVQSGGEDLAAKYTNVIAYIQYMKLYDAIDVSIFDEIEFLERTVKNKLFTTPEQVKLDHILRIYDIYCKMFDFTLTKQDAEFYYTYQDEFKAETFSNFLNPLMSKYHFTYGLPSQVKTLDQDLPRVERFYKAALDRDQILVERAVEKTFATGEKMSAIVTGGFHTPGIEKYLREKDISYIVVAPRITKTIDKKKESALYDAALRETPLPIEKVLSEAFLKPQTGVLNDPRFQLAAEHMTPSFADLSSRKDLSLARAEVRMSIVASIAGERDAARALENMHTAAMTLDPSGRSLMDAEFAKFDGAYVDGNIIWLLNGTATAAFRIQSAEQAARARREIPIAGARGATQTYQVGNEHWTYFPNIDRDLTNIPQTILDRHNARFGVGQARVGGLDITIGQLTSKPAEIGPNVGAEIQAAREAAIRAAQAKTEQERYSRNLQVLNGFLGVDLIKSGIVTSGELQRLLRNRNFDAKLLVIKETATMVADASQKPAGFTDEQFKLLKAHYTAKLKNPGFVCEILLRHSAKKIGSQVQSLFDHGISLNTYTMRLSAYEMPLRAEQDRLTRETTERQAAEAKPMVPAVAKPALAAEKLSLDAVMRQILGKHKDQPVSTMKGLPRILFGADTQTLIARIQAEFGYDDTDMALLVEATGLKLDAGASQWWHVYTQLEKAYESVINFRSAQAAEAGKAIPEGLSFLQRVGIRMWRVVEWVVVVGPHLLDQFFYGFFRRKISFYWFRSGFWFIKKPAQPFDREISLDVLAGAMLDAAKPVSGVQGAVRRAQENNVYQFLDRTVIEPFAIPTLQFIQRRWKLAVFGAIGAGLVALFLPAGLATASLLGVTLSTGILHATAGIPVIGIVTGAFVNAFTVSSFLNTAILSFLLTVPSFSGKYAEAMMDRIVMQQLQGLKGIKNLDYMSVRQVISQIFAAEQLTAAQKVLLLQELQAVLPSVRYKQARRKRWSKDFWMRKWKF
ncbi:MAG: hypothetical protein WC331_01380 [Candidatus Omnitrophota bacterium]|jgi:hypothetical protein